MAGEIYAGMRARHPSPKEGDLRVWWIPQVPGTPFHWPVASTDEAALLLDALAAYDDFQFRERVKGDYANAGGLERYEEGDWSDWYDEATSEDFDGWRNA